MEINWLKKTAIVINKIFFAWNTWVLGLWELSSLVLTRTQNIKQKLGSLKD